jgi:hypothetical protein
LREVYAVIDELAPDWSGSSIATVLRAFLAAPEPVGWAVREKATGQLLFRSAQQVVADWGADKYEVVPLYAGAPEAGSDARGEAANGP